MADGMQIACTPLLDWLQAVCTRVTVNGAPLEALPLAQLPPAAPVTNADLLQHCWELVMCNLPVLDPAQIHHGAQHIATTIGQLAMEQHITWEEAAQARVAQENHMVESCFPVSLALLPSPHG